MLYKYRSLFISSLFPEAQLNLASTHHSSLYVLRDLVMCFSVPKNIAWELETQAGEDGGGAAFWGKFLRKEKLTHKSNRPQTLATGNAA